MVLMRPFILEYLKQKLHLFLLQIGRYQLMPMVEIFGMTIAIIFGCADFRTSSSPSSQP